MTSGTEALKLWMAKLMDFIQHCKYIYYTHTHTHTHTHTYGGRTYEGKCYFVKFIWFVYSDIWSFIQNNWDQTYFRLRIFQSLERSVSFWWLLGWMELKLLSPVSRIKCGTGRGGSGVVQFSSVQSLSRVRLFATPWIAARQASLSITNSRSSLRLTSRVVTYL